MAARAIWKGEICFEEHRVPVKLYSAVQDRNIHFNLLHDQDMVRVKQRMVNPETGEEVASAGIQKGFPLDRQRFVVLSDDELAELEPPSSRDIEIICFVAPELINHQWYDRPYWLGPDGDADTYFALAEALEQRGCEGVARWTMRNNEYLGALRAQEGYLLLETLRHAEEVLDASKLPAPEGRDLTDKERLMAGQLIEALADDFRPDDFHDEHRQRVMELIETKKRGEQWEWKTYEPAEEPDSLSESLAASLRTVSKR